RLDRPSPTTPIYTLPYTTLFRSFLCNSSPAAPSPFARIKPPRGPHSVLCVVDVTTCAYGNGFGYRPTATSPATCAMSTTNHAPRSEEHTSELQSRENLVCRLLLE